VPARPVLLIVAGLTIAVLALTSAIRGHLPENLSEWLAPIGPTVTAAAVGLAIFNRWVWHFPLVRKAHGRPVLRGTWHGELASQWINPQTGAGIPPDPDVFLVVRQTFWTVSVRLITKESKSVSLSADLRDTGDGVYELAYLYSNEPRLSVQHRSKPHTGAAMLATPVDRSAGLEGMYFTPRPSQGEMRFRQHFTKLVETHEQGLALLEPQPPRSRRSLRTRLRRDPS
jgi:hypothetical protein